MTQSKIMWIDLETTGTNPLTHGITQLGAICEIDGEVIEELNLAMRPTLKQKIDEAALEKQGITEEVVRTYPHQSDQFAVFKQFLEKYVNRYEKLDKFVLAGYNINAFDEPFLREWFLLNAATREERKYGNYFGSYFFWPKRDVQTYLAEHIAEHSLRLPDYKLETACGYFNIPITAHDALSDIRATRTLYMVLRYTISTAMQAA